MYFCASNLHAAKVSQDGQDEYATHDLIYPILFFFYLPCFVQHVGDHGTLKFLSFVALCNVYHRSD